MASPKNGIILLVTCSSMSNFAKTAARTALTLQQLQPGRYEWAQAKQSRDTIEAIADMTDYVFVLDGCQDCCGKKKLDEIGMKADEHLIISDLLCIKKNMDEPRPEDIEKVLKAIGER